MGFNIFWLIREHLSKKELRRLMAQLPKAKDDKEKERIEYMMQMCELLPYWEYKTFIKKSMEG